MIGHRVQNKKIKAVLILLVSFNVLLVSGCQQHFLTGPTAPTEADLVANAIGNGLTQEIPINYEQAFKNLSSAYSRCMAFTSEKGYVFTDNRFEPHIEMATLFGRTTGGVFLYKTTLEGMSSHSSRITLFLPQGYSFARARLKQDVSRALGQDPLCNLKSNQSTAGDR